MSYYAEHDPGEFENAPSGNHSGVCVDFVDRGVEVGQFGPQHRVQYTFLINERLAKDPEKHHQVVKIVTNSLHPKSNLYKFLRSWLGREEFERRVEFVERDGRQVARFDLECVVGIPALLNCQLNDKGTFTNIESIGPLPGGMEPMAVPDYFIRKKDRPDYEPPAKAPVHTDADYDGADDDEEDGLPF